MPTPHSSPNPDPSDGPFTRLDDEQYDELVELQGQKVVFAAVWEDALVDALADLSRAEDGPPAVDLDLYLQDGAYFELFGVVCYPSLDDDPWPGRAEVDATLKSLIRGGCWLEEIAVDEEEAMVLVLARRHQPRAYLQVGAWLLGEWEELPNETAS